MKLLTAFVAGVILPSTLAVAACAEDGAAGRGTTGNAIHMETLELQHEGWQTSAVPAGAGKIARRANSDTKEETLK